MDLKPPRTSGLRDAPLATAKWAESDEIAPLRYEEGSDQFWIGRASLTPDGKPKPIGYADDRHVCLVSGSRGGKGTTVILNNLISWPGSVVCIDPKGENATIAAARRGPGSTYAKGMGQAVHVLDPFRTADVPDETRSRFNPLDTIDPASDEAIDEAARIAEEGWETFLGNAGLKLFFHIEDQFTREYISRQLGEAELTRKTASEGKGLNMAAAGASRSPGMGLLSLVADNLNLQSSEGIHKTRLIAPEEIGQVFARVDDPAHNAFPGLGLALVPGKNPIIVKRTNYFSEPVFAGQFDPHPDHQAPQTLQEREDAPPEPVEDDSESINPVLLDYGLGAGIIAFLGIAAHRITTVGGAVDHAGLKIVIPIAVVMLAGFLYDLIRKHVLRLERSMNDNQFFIALGLWLAVFLSLAYGTSAFDAVALSLWSSSP